MTDRKRKLAELAANFVGAFNRHDIDAAMAFVCETAIFEDARGGRFVGKQAIRDAFMPLFNGTLGSPIFHDDDLFVDVEQGKVAVSWELQITVAGVDKRLRGVDMLHFDGDKLARKLTYAKAETPPYLSKT